MRQRTRSLRCAIGLAARRGIPTFAHALVALAATWPLAAHLGTQLPLGDEATATVPLFNLWTLRWNAQRIAHGFHDYWNAPIFAPTKGTFARSEAQPITGAAFALLRWLLNDAAGYNLVLLMFLTLNGIAGGRFARRVGATKTAAILAGVGFQTLPFVFNQLGVLQLVCVFPLVFTIERILAYRESPRLSTLSIAGLWCIATVLTSGYYAIFLVIMLIVAAPVLLVRAVAPARLVAHGLVVAVVVLAVVVPYLAAQRDHLDSHDTWSVATVTGLSAQPNDFLDQPKGRRPLATIRSDSNNNGIQESPGPWLAGFAFCGVVAGWRMRQRRLVVALVSMTLTMFVLSLGLRFSILGWHPYRVLYDDVSGFDRLRSPFRFSVGVQLGLAMLSSLTIVAIWRWRWAAGRIIIFVRVLLIFFEVVPLGAARVRAPEPSRQPWVQYLRTARAGNVAMIPFPIDSHASSFQGTVVAMLASLDHHHPLVNGYSGFFPQQFDRETTPAGLWSAMDGFPSWCGLEALHQRKVVYVVAQRAWYSAARAESLNELGYSEVAGDSDMIVLRDTKHYEIRNECG